MQKKKKTMSRQEALELYQDMQKTMSKMIKNTEGMETGPKSAQAMRTPTAIPHRPSVTREISGQRFALSMLISAAALKVCFAALDFAGVTSVPVAIASVAQQQQPAQQFSKEEIKLLTSLDSRRAELEVRNKKLDAREKDFERRDQEFASKLTELREITGKLKLERDKDDKKKVMQLEQLANVYIAMAPQDAAPLLEQLDETIALALLERMPEKRMGQILPLMSSDKALRITKMLSDRKG